MKRLIVLFLYLILFCSCNNKACISQSDSMYVKFDTIGYGDRRFHDEVGAYIYGITAEGDTTQIKWIDYE